MFLGAFVVNATTYGTPLTALGIATGNALEGLVAAWPVERFANGARAFERARDVFRPAGLAGLLATTRSASLGVASLTLGRFAPWRRSGAIWFTWWLGDVVGALEVAPLLVVWARAARPRWAPRPRLGSTFAFAIPLRAPGAAGEAPAPEPAAARS